MTDRLLMTLVAFVGAYVFAMALLMVATSPLAVLGFAPDGAVSIACVLGAFACGVVCAVLTWRQK